MKGASFLILALATSGLQAATAPSDREHLRSLLTVPRAHVEFGLGVTARDGIVLMGEEPDPAVELPKVKASLSGSLNESPRYLQLARLYSRLRQGNPSSNALAQAITLGRKRLDLQPASAEAMRHLAEALAYSGENAEAEALFRRAVRTAPRDWESHAALGQFLGNRAAATLVRDGDSDAALPTLLESLAEHRLTADQVSRCRELVAEGVQCLDEAVALTPDNADARLARAQFRTLAEMTRLFARVGQGDQPETGDLVKALAPVVVLPDMRRAVELRPNDPRLAALAACYELFVAAGNRGVGSMEDLANGRFYQSLTDSEQRMLRNKFQRLEEIGQGANPTNAAAALQYLGSLQLMVMRDLEGAAANLRRAVALDSSREQAWDLLMASLLMQDGKDGGGLAVAEARVKASPTARNFVLLAKMAYEAGKMDQALTAAQRAIRIDSRSFFAQHTLGVLLALEGRDREQLSRAEGPLAAAGRLADERIPPDDLVRFLVNAACYHGLAGEPSVGLKLARQALQVSSKDAEAKAAVETLQRMAGTP